MPSLERTAYPRFGRIITALELERVYTPTPEEMAWARATVRTPNHLLCLAVSLKCFQQLHYFPDLELVPEAVVNHVRQCFDPSTLRESVNNSPESVSTPTECGHNPPVPGSPAVWAFRRA
jgi:hypothetical protein